MRHALYFRFADEAAAIAALPAFRVTSEDGELWNAARVDAGVPIIETPATFDSDGIVIAPAVFAEGFFLNLLLDARDEALEAVEGWVGTMEETDDPDPSLKWQLVAGDHPRTPQRVFA